MASAFKSKVLKDTGVTATTVYTCPGATSTTVIGMTICNTIGTSVNVDVTYVKGATTVYLAKGSPVPVGGSLVLVGGDQKVVVEATDYIQVKSSAAASVDTIMSILEIT